MSKQGLVSSGCNFPVAFRCGAVGKEGPHTRMEISQWQSTCPGWCGPGFDPDYHERYRVKGVIGHSDVNFHANQVQWVLSELTGAGSLRKIIWAIKPGNRHLYVN